MWNVTESGWRKTTLRKRILGAQIALNCMNSTFLSRPLIHLQEVGWELRSVPCQSEEDRNGCSPGTSQEVVCFVLSGYSSGSNCNSTRAHPKENTFLPAPNVCGIWGAYELPNTHMCERQPPAPCANLRTHTHSHRGFSQSGHLYFLCSLSEECVYVVPDPILPD